MRLALQLPAPAQPGSQGLPLRLISLEPHPVAGQFIAKPDYLATLRIQGIKGSASERSADE